MPDRPISQVTYRAQDVRDRDGCYRSMKLDNPDRVFHLAAMTHLQDCEAEPDRTFETNVRGSVHVISAMPTHAKAVFASTCHVYGRPETDKIGETHPADPSGQYAESKLAAEEAVLSLGRPVVVARAFHHTGPGQSDRYVLSDWATQIRSGKDVIDVGNLEVRRDFSDVRDIVRGYACLGELGEPGERYNLCSGVSRTLANLFGMLAANTMVRARVDAGRLRQDDVAVFCGDPSKARSLGWTPRISIDQTLKEMV